MANHARNNRAFKTAANFTGKAATSTFKCATTDHLDMSRVFLDMPSMGFLSTLKYIFMQFMFVVVTAVITGIWVFLLVAYGIPFLFSLIF